MPRKNTKSKSKASASKSIPKDKRLPYSVCSQMTVRQIRQTPEYKGLTPLGKLNKSGTYKYGNKSTMRKEALCQALDNPKRYHEQIISAKKEGKNTGPRKRKTRKGECLVAQRKLPCDGQVYKYEGVTTTGKSCCFKKKMSKKTIDKRLRAVREKIAKQNESAGKSKQKK